MTEDEIYAAVINLPIEQHFIARQTLVGNLIAYRPLSFYEDSIRYYLKDIGSTLEVAPGKLSMRRIEGIRRHGYNPYILLSIIASALGLNKSKTEIKLELFRLSFTARLTHD